jgi:hypothetical protein
MLLIDILTCHIFIFSHEPSDIVILLNHILYHTAVHMFEYTHAHKLCIKLSHEIGYKVKLPLCTPERDIGVMEV